MRGFRTLLFVATLIAAGPGRALDVVRDEQRNEFTLFLSGPIVAGDLRKIVAAVTPPRKFPKYFTLDSPGGDLMEAMVIGRFIRETASGTSVGRTCSSACVFLLVAGVSRNANEGTAVGLHRPYFDQKEFAGLSLPDAEKRYKVLHEMARRYLEEMEVPTAAIEKMFSIASDDVYYLTRQDAARVLVAPSAYSEWIRAKCSPPTAQDSELFKARGFNIYARYDKNPPTDPAFWAYIGKMDQSEQCESNLVAGVRREALRRYKP